MNFSFFCSHCDNENLISIDDEKEFYHVECAHCGFVNICQIESYEPPEKKIEKMQVSKHRFEKTEPIPSTDVEKDWKCKFCNAENLTSFTQEEFVEIIDGESYMVDCSECGKENELDFFLLVEK